jgi:type III secretion system low calcium response chaperone LcrH/SycD
MNVSQDSIEALYFIAYGCYNQGKYDDAVYYFRTLTSLDTRTKKHWMGLGASLQMQKNYQKAIEAYENAAAIDPTDPYVHFHAADCLHSQGNIQDALFALSCCNRAISLNAPSDQLNNLFKHIKLMSKCWKASLNKKVNNL